MKTDRFLKVQIKNHKAGERISNWPWMTWEQIAREMGKNIDEISIPVDDVFEVRLKESGEPVFTTKKRGRPAATAN